MNSKRFLRIVIIFSTIAAISLYFGFETVGEEHTMFSFVMSIPATIFLIPQMLWFALSMDMPNHKYYIHFATFFGVVLYAYILERLIRRYRN